MTDSYGWEILRDAALGELDAREAGDTPCVTPVEGDWIDELVNWQLEKGGHR